MDERALCSWAVTVERKSSRLRVTAESQRGSPLHLEVSFSGTEEGALLRVRDVSGERIFRRDALARHPSLTAVLRLIADEVDMARPAVGDGLLSFLFQSLHIYVSRVSGPVVMGERGPILRDRRVERALQLLNADIARRWTVELLAREVGLSRAAFARQFHRVLGRSPMRFLRDRRMQVAAELLFASDVGLAELAACVGYGSEFAFNRAFTRYHQVPPGEYRRRSPTRMGAATRMAA